MNIPFLSLKDVTAAHGEEIQAAVKLVVDSGWYLQGEENARFEKDYAAYIDCEHCTDYTYNAYEYKTKRPSHNVKLKILHGITTNVML